MAFCYLTLKAPKPKSSKYPKEFKQLGDHIRKCRLDLGLFQKQVAECIGVDEATIYHWECNETNPPNRHIPQIIRFLEYNPLPQPEQPGRSFSRLEGNSALLRK